MGYFQLVHINIMSDKLPPVIVPVSSLTGQTYEDFEAVLGKEGTKVLKEKWTALTNNLRIYLQIEYTPAASPSSVKPPISVLGDGSGLGTKRKP